MVASKGDEEALYYQRSAIQNQRSIRAQHLYINMGIWDSGGWMQKAETVTCWTRTCDAVNGLMAYVQSSFRPVLVQYRGKSNRQQ